jgi:hypothetical protein
MAVFALWSAPRTRSTVLFRSMAERGDMTVLHEPFCNLRDYGVAEAGARTFDSTLALLAWLRDETHDLSVFVKDHPPTACVRNILWRPELPRARPACIPHPPSRGDSGVQLRA